MRKILVVATDGLTKSGVPNVLVNIIKSLSGEKYSFDVLYFDEKDAYYKPEIEKYGGKTIYSPIDMLKTSKFKKLKVKLQYKKELIKIIKKYGPYDCVHSFKGFESGYILKAAKKMRIKNRISHMTFFYRKPINFLIRLIEKNEMRLVKKYSTVIISDSERTSSNNIPNCHKNLVIRNCVDEESFPFSDLNCSSKGICFIQIGSYCCNKNQLFSLSVFIRVLSKFPDSKLHYVGFRNPDETEYLDKLKGEVERNHLSNKVIFHEHNADTRELFKQCHYLLFPSQNESFGIVVVEAQLSGLMCFCSDSISIEGNCGGCKYLSLSDPNVWSKEIIESFESDGGLHKKYDCSRFDKETIMKQYADIYEGSSILK